MHIFWQLLGDAPLLVQVLTLLQLAFTVWMAVDAYRRQVETFWFWLLFFFQPIGAWVYFFAVKFRGLRWPALRFTAHGERRLSLDELRYRVERTPTVANRLAFAERLMEKRQHAEAVPHLEAILNVEPDYCVALHALAECRLATADAERALAPLEKLLGRDQRWSNYRAWRTLIDVHEARGQPADALKACRELEKRLPTLENKCLLAEYLLDNRVPAEAVRLLEQALEDHHFTPWSIRLSNWRWARTARRLLVEADQANDAAQGPS